VPLLFAQSQTFGVSIGGTAQEQGVDMTLGFRDRNFAIVPVSTPQAGGTYTQLAAKVTADDNASGSDAFSVLGQFDANTDAKTARVGLGKFFATGIAARRLADGFSRRLANEGGNAGGSGNGGNANAANNNGDASRNANGVTAPGGSSGSGDSDNAAPGASKGGTSVASASPVSPPAAPAANTALDSRTPVDRGASAAAARLRKPTPKRQDAIAPAH
jgi:hypothetical protein